MIKVTIRGAEQMQAVLAEADNALLAACRDTTRYGAQTTKDIAKNLCPVRTGFLQSRIYYRTVDPYTAYVGDDADYAGFVELGTSRMRGQPFLRPAAAFAMTQIEPMFVQIIDGYLRSLGK